MWNPPVIIGLVAVALFVTTAFYVNMYIKGLKTPPAPATQEQQVSYVVVAAKDLSLGTRLEPAHLRTVEWPRDAVPAGAVSDAASVVGSLTIASIVQNEPLLPGKIANHNGHSLLSFKIPGGMRAASIRVNAVTGISGFVAPGTKVDVIAVLSAGDSEGAPSAITLLEDVEVLAIAQEMDPQAKEPAVVNTITLLVTPAQAERLALAASAGTLQLTLRGYTDQYPAGTRGVSMADMTLTRKGSRTTVELIRGREKAIHTF